MERLMQFLTALFGGPENTYLNAAFALGLVIVLIALGAWVLKLFARGVSAAPLSRGRNRRLSVVDQVNVDPRRKLIIVRRDNVEHLILTGGPQDLLVESGIPVADAATSRRPATRTQPTTEADIRPPAEAVATVSRETIDQLRDLARPSPLNPTPPLRRTSLLRPVTTQEPGIIPTGPELRVDNVGGARLDSAKSETAIGSGSTRLGGVRNRFFRNFSGHDRA
jgi:flagellar protein FliO/FliZ